MKNLIVWLVIIITIAMLFDSQGDKLSNSFFSTFLPHQGRVQGKGSIEFTKSLDGHFYIQAQINNRNVIFLLDTGASDIILSQKDVIYTGINLQNAQSFKTYETANGRVEARVIQIPQIKLGNFLINNVEASVNTYSMSHSLLGMSFLKYFDFIIKDNKLILYHN